MLSQYARRVRQVPRPIRYFATDESRFGLKTLVGRLITACGIKPIGQWQWLFKAFWVYGAVEPTTGEGFFLQFSHVDTDCYQRFVDEFSPQYPDSLNILQADHGRFHTSKDLVVPENIILRHLSGGILPPENAVLFQPPYCQATFWGEASPQKLAPELNPIER